MEQKEEMTNKSKLEPLFDVKAALDTAYNTAIDHSLKFINSTLEWVDSNDVISYIHKLTNSLTKLKKQ